MRSLRACLVDLVLPLLGIKRFFSEPERMRERIAKMRGRPAPRPGRKWRRRFDIREGDVDGVAVVTMAPRAGTGSDAPHLLYLHGGGYVMDIASVHWDAVAHLCESLGASASVPLYPLAPEHTAERTLQGIEAIYTDLADRYGPANLTVMGDSAGGGMALALVQRLDPDVRPAGLVLFSPWLDATCSEAGQEATERNDRMLSRNGLVECGRMYAGNLSTRDPAVSPLFGPLEDLPPTAIFAGTHDILVSDARRLNEKLATLDKEDVLYREHEGMMHVWMLLPIPEGRSALAEAAAFIEDCRRGSTQ